MIKRNAKEEFLQAVKDRPVKCAIVKVINDDYTCCSFSLKLGFAEIEYQKFLNDLDFCYEINMKRCLFGDVWHYEGYYQYREFIVTSDQCYEYWNCVKFPEIPKELY